MKVYNKNEWILVHTLFIMMDSLDMKNIINMNESSYLDRLYLVQNDGQEYNKNEWILDRTLFRMMDMKNIIKMNESSIVPCSEWWTWRI